MHFPGSDSRPSMLPVKHTAMRAGLGGAWPVEPATRSCHNRGEASQRRPGDAMSKRQKSAGFVLLAAAGICSAVWAGPPASQLPAKLMHSHRPVDAPVANAAFIPSSDSGPCAPFAGVIEVAQSTMRTLPILDKPIIDGRDARLFPGVKLGFFSMGDV